MTPKSIQTLLTIHLTRKGSAMNVTIEDCFELTAKRYVVLSDNYGAKITPMGQEYIDRLCGVSV